MYTDKQLAAMEAETDRQDARIMYKQGKTILQIAKSLGVPAGRVVRMVID